ncbi:hypothetical protein BJV78DRAFT_1252258 [Lactifluus subvellereus]|nr:hypothetical protein BJV78DRAFT_1252258 [Lactifluus subvellereus]
MAASITSSDWIFVVVSSPLSLSYCRCAPVTVGPAVVVIKDIPVRQCPPSSCCPPVFGSPLGRWRRTPPAW